MRNIALQNHKLYELYIEVHMQAFLAKHIKNLALIVY